MYHDVSQQVLRPLSCRFQLNGQDCCICRYPGGRSAEGFLIPVDTPVFLTRAYRCDTHNFSRLYDYFT